MIPTLPKTIQVWKPGQNEQKDEGSLGRRSLSILKDNISNLTNKARKAGLPDPHPRK